MVDRVTVSPDGMKYRLTLRDGLPMARWAAGPVGGLCGVAEALGKEGSLRPAPHAKRCFARARSIVPPWQAAISIGSSLALRSMMATFRPAPAIRAARGGLACPIADDDRIAAWLYLAFVVECRTQNPLITPKLRARCCSAGDGSACGLRGGLNRFLAEQRQRASLRVLAVLQGVHPHGLESNAQRIDPPSAPPRARGELARRKPLTATLLFHCYFSS